MKKMITKTLLILAPLTFLGCAGTPAQKTADTSDVSSSRAPASTPTAATAWGKEVSPESQDLLDEIENAPVGRYPGKKLP